MTCVANIEKKHYNVEMQTANKDNLERCIRYYQGMIDRGTLEKGVSYTETSDSYIIFIFLLNQSS